MKSGERAYHRLRHAVTCSMRWQEISLLLDNMSAKAKKRDSKAEYPDRVRAAEDIWREFDENRVPLLKCYYICR